MNRFVLLVSASLSLAMPALAQSLRPSESGSSLAAQTAPSTEGSTTAASPVSSGSEASGVKTPAPTSEGSAPSPTAAPVASASTTPTASVPPPDRTDRWSFFGGGFGMGLAATAFTVPTTVALASYIGTLSSGLVGAAVPSLLTLLLLPPLLATFAMWTYANLIEDGGFKLTPAFWAALGTHAVVVIVAGILGADAQLPGDMILLTLADAVLLPAATFALMDRTRIRPAPGVNLRWEF